MSKISEVGLVVAGGAVGGLLLVIDAWTDPVTYPLTAMKLLSLLVIPMLKGGAAAGIGVYLLTTMDSTHLTRAFFFSVACGLTFPTVLAKGASVADATRMEIAAVTIDANADRIRQVSTKGLTPESVNELRGASLEILKAAPLAKEKDRKTASAALDEAISSLGEAGRKEDGAMVVDAITQIGATAAFHDFSFPANSAIAELSKLQKNPGLSAQEKRDALMGIKIINAPDSKI